MSTQVADSFQGGSETVGPTPRIGRCRRRRPHTSRCLTLGSPANTLTAMRRFFALLLSLPLAASNVRIIQTNSAGDDVSIIDPATNKVVGVIKGIEVNHGAAVAPDGSRYYISNEGRSTLDVVDRKTLKVTRNIPLNGHPNNIAISKDGRRVYVSIAVAPGSVDVI